MVARRVQSVAAFGLAAAVPVAFAAFLGCMDGTTPTCGPDSGCGTVIDGTVAIDTGGDAAVEAPAEATSDSPPPADSSPADTGQPVDSSALDAPVDAPTDAPAG